LTNKAKRGAIPVCGVSRTDEPLFIQQQKFGESIMNKPLHMISSITWEKLSSYQNEYVELSSSGKQPDRLRELEILFEKVDLGKILVGGAK
jgi:hypothetical protein